MIFLYISLINTQINFARTSGQYFPQHTWVWVLCERLTWKSCEILGNMSVLGKGESHSACRASVVKGCHWLSFLYVNVCRHCVLTSRTVLSRSCFCSFVQIWKNSRVWMEGVLWVILEWRQCTECFLVLLLHSLYSTQQQQTLNSAISAAWIPTNRSANRSPQILVLIYVMRCVHEQSVSHRLLP